MKTYLRNFYAFFNGITLISSAGSANYKNTICHKIQQRTPAQSIAFYWFKTGDRIKRASSQFAEENNLNHVK